MINVRLIKKIRMKCSIFFFTLKKLLRNDFVWNHRDINAIISQIAEIVESVIDHFKHETANTFSYFFMLKVAFHDWLIHSFVPPPFEFHFSWVKPTLFFAFLLIIIHCAHCILCLYCSYSIRHHSLIIRFIKVTASPSYLLFRIHFLVVIRIEYFLFCYAPSLFFLSDNSMVLVTESSKS